VSVPGAVGRDGFSYYQIILGHLAGYLVIAFVLLPLYYRDRVTSIYHVLETRLGRSAHRTGAAFFLVSRTLGACVRLYLVCRVLHAMLIASSGVPFAVTAFVVVALIVAYTYEGGVKTIVWTDLLQTACMLSDWLSSSRSCWRAWTSTFPEASRRLSEAGLSRMFVLDPMADNFVVKHFVAGLFIAVAMAGMDQEMMQKNISVRTLAASQKNVLLMLGIMMAVVLGFLYLGGLLHLYAPAAGITESGDRLFPAVVMQSLPEVVQIVFLIALISALFPSADGALTALTSSFCVDILRLRDRADLAEEAQARIRKRVHLHSRRLLRAGARIRGPREPSMIVVLLKIAAYSYGPLLGLFAFAIFTRRRPIDRWVPLVAIAAPFTCYAVDHYQEALFGSYRIGLEILAVNGALTFAGLWLVSRKGRL
jgi:Na+/proline symporter